MTLALIEEAIDIEKNEYQITIGASHQLVAAAKWVVDAPVSELSNRIQNLQRVAESYEKLVSELSEKYPIAFD